MLINNKDKIIILHNPKTGGRFSHAVCSNKDFKPLLKGNNIIGKIHSTYDEIKDAIPVNELNSYRIISMIRNPYDRFVSAAKFSFGMVFGGQGLSYSIDNTLYLIEQNKEKYILSREKPWFLPQSLYLGDNVEVLRYENYDDWVKLSGF